MAERHPDLLTRVEAAALLGVSVSTLAKGWGPPPLPQYKRPRYYSKDICERWMDAHKGATWDYTSAKARQFGGAAFKSPAAKSNDQLARQVEERLRSKSAACAHTTKARHLIAVPEEST
jgi:hypothetical protein